MKRRWRPKTCWSHVPERFSSSFVREMRGRRNGNNPGKKKDSPTCGFRKRGPSFPAEHQQVDSWLTKYGPECERIYFSVSRCGPRKRVGLDCFSKGTLVLRGKHPFLGQVLTRPEGLGPTWLLKVLAAYCQAKTFTSMLVMLTPDE